MTTEEEWIYLDEDIPEIHIREIISIDELLTTYPQFVALSDEEIYNKLFIIFQNRSVTANTYYELHKEITQPEDIFEKYYKQVLYHVHALRKRADSDDYQTKYLETLDAISQNQNYITRQIMKAELLEPFEAGDVIDTENKISIPKERLLQIQLTTSEIQPDNTIRLHTDKETYDILSADFIKETHVSSMYVAEHKKAPVKSDVLQTNKVDIETLRRELVSNINNQDIFKLFTQTIIPSISDILQHIDVKNISDMRSLQVLFQIYGRDIEEIDINTYEKLVAILQETLHTGAEGEEDEQEKEYQHKKKNADQVNISKKIEISDVKIHSLFWKSILGRLLIAKDAPTYSIMIEETAKALLMKPFKTDIYQNVSKQLKKLEEGSMKLDEFINEIKLLRQLEERNNVFEFRNQVQTLWNEQSSKLLQSAQSNESGQQKNDIFDDLQKRIDEIETLLKTTIDPNEAENMFTTKPFIQRQVEIEEIKAGTSTTVEYVDEEQNIIESGVELYIPALPEDDDEIEPEETIDLLSEVLDSYEPSSIIQLFKSIQPILTRLQELTNMPWDPVLFMKIIVQRAPPLMNITTAMYAIDHTIRNDILNKIEESSFEDAMSEFILPQELEHNMKKTYNEARKKMKEQKIHLFFMFIAYWILHIQSLMIEDLFVLQDLHDISCKNELRGIGFPIEENREGRRGVLHYFICVLQNEGHDIPNIREQIDDFSKDELDKRIRACFNYFTHEIDTLKNQHHSDVIYQGNNVIKEADEIYQTLKDFQKKKFKSREMIKPYIRNLQLLPTLLRDAKQQHKHILGCCYARLDSNFQAERNLDKSGIIASREYFARKRIGKAARPQLLYYQKPKTSEIKEGEQKTAEMKEVKESKRKIEPEELPFSLYEKPEKQKKKLVEKASEAEEEEEEAPEIEWRDKLKQLTFLSSTVKLILNKANRNEESQLQDEAHRYIEALFKSATTKLDKDLWDMIKNLSNNECISVIIQITFDFYEYIRTLRTNLRRNSTQSIYQDEIEWMETELNKLQDIIGHIKAIEIPEEDYKEFHSLLTLILCRSVCLPGDVEPSRTVITTERNIHANFIKDLAKNIAKKLEKHIEIRKMPTKEDIDKKIAEIREQQKNKKYERYDENAELAKLETEMERQGYKAAVKERTKGAQKVVLNRIVEDIQADREGVNDFAIRSENPDDIDEDRFGDY